MIVTLEIEFKNALPVQALFVNGRLIASNNSDDNTTLSLIDTLADKLNAALPEQGNTSVDKAADSDLDDFNFNEFQTELYAYCKDHTEEYGAMPMDFEFNDIVFDFDEYIHFITKENHKTLSQIME